MLNILGIWTSPSISPRAEEVVMTQSLVLVDDFDTIGAVSEAPLDHQAFDYTTVAPDIAQTLRTSAERIRAHHREAILKAGKELLEAKKLLGHGRLGDWVRGELHFSERTARNYMRAAKAFGDKTAIVAVLSPAVLYMIAAARPTVWRHVETLIASGETVDRTKAAELINAEAEDLRLRNLSDRERKKEEAARRRDKRSREKCKAAEEKKTRQARAKRHAAADTLIGHLHARFTLGAIRHLDELWRACEGTLLDRVELLEADLFHKGSMPQATYDRQRKLTGVTELRNRERSAEPALVQCFPEKHHGSAIPLDAGTKASADPLVP